MSLEEDASDEVAISTDQFAQLMGAINASQARMEEKFTEFRAEVWQGQEDAAAKALKRARYKKPYAFKRKDNKEQAAFNAKLDERVAKAEAEPAGAGPSTTPAV